VARRDAYVAHATAGRRTARTARAQSYIDVNQYARQADGISSAAVVRCITRSGKSDIERTNRRGMLTNS
jgi:hypothetical protein